MSLDLVAEGGRCEELEKITIDNDDDKYFQALLLISFRSSRNG